MLYNILGTNAPTQDATPASLSHAIESNHKSNRSNALPAHSSSDKKTDRLSPSTSAPRSHFPKLLLFLPVLRAEVLLAVGTGNTTLWEERLLRYARTQLEAMAPRNEASRVLLCKIAHMNITPFGASREVREDDTEDMDGTESTASAALNPTSTNTTSASWWVWTRHAAPRPATSIVKEHACFASFSGPNFHLLLELMQYAICTERPYLTFSEKSSSHALPCCAKDDHVLCWGDELLHILSTLLTFHGTVPAVGYFVSVLLWSYVETLLRLRHRTANSFCEPCDAVQLPRGNPCGGVNQTGLYDSGEQDDTEEDEEAKREAAFHLQRYTQWESHLSVLHGKLFSSLIARLARLYFPLWRMFREESMMTSARGKHSTILTLYTHCVPSPIHSEQEETMRHLGALAVVPPSRKPGKVHQSPSKSSQEGTTNTTSTHTNATKSTLSAKDKEESHVTLKTPTSRQRLNAMLRGVFSRSSTINFHSSDPIALSDKSENGTRTGEQAHSELMEHDIALNRDYVDEVSICVSLLESGRLALLHDLLWLRPLPTQNERKSHPTQEVEEENEDDDEGRNRRTVKDATRTGFLQHVRRIARCSTAGMMNSSAKVLLAVEESWRKPSADSTETSAEKHAGNHLWIATTMQNVLATIARTSSTPLEHYLRQQQEQEQKRAQQNWSCELRDYYFLNLLLVSCCLGGAQLHASLLPFTLQLVRLATSDDILADQRGQIRGLKWTHAAPTKEAEKVSEAEEEAHSLAVDTLCMTACKFLRFGYQLGFVVPNNEQVRWLSIALKRQVRLWSYLLRQTVLLMNVTNVYEKSKPTPTANSAPPPVGAGAAKTTAKTRAVTQTMAEEISNLWRVLWWRTVTILECLYVIRDLFRVSSAWSVVNDTVAFRVVISELAETLCMVCWIDTSERSMPTTTMAHNNSYRYAYDNHKDRNSQILEGVDAVSSSSPRQAPFPVMVSLERRFFLGSMLAFVLCASADTIVAYHAWMDTRDVCLSDTENENLGEINLSFLSNPLLGSKAIQWLYGLYFFVLLPCTSRVLQSIALCVPEESMLPAVLRLFKLISSNCMLNSASSLTNNAAATSYAETLHMASMISSILSLTQEALLQRATKVLKHDRSLDAENEDDSLWVLRNSHALLYVCEILGLRVVWATKTSLTPESVPGVENSVVGADSFQHGGKSDGKESMGLKYRVPTKSCGSVNQQQSQRHHHHHQQEEGDHEKNEEDVENMSSVSEGSSFNTSTSDADSGASCFSNEEISESKKNSTRCIPKKEKMMMRMMSPFLPTGPPPPPLFDTIFLSEVAIALLRILVLRRDESSASLAQANRPTRDVRGPFLSSSSSSSPSSSLLATSLVQSIHALLFGLVRSLFRAAESTVYQRAVLQEQLRRRPRDQGCKAGVRTNLHPQQHDEDAKNETSWSWMIPTFITNWTPLWYFSSSETDATREAQWNLEAIDAFIEFHQQQICKSVTHLASTLGSLQRTLLEDESSNASPRFTHVSACCGAVLRLLSQQCMESLLPDLSVPSSFQLTPLPQHVPPTTAISVVSSWWPFALARGDASWEATLTHATRCQSTALLRVVTAVASLTRTEKAPPPPPPATDGDGMQEMEGTAQFVLHPAVFSMGNWRKLAFALRVVRWSEVRHGDTQAPCSVCASGEANSEDAAQTDKHCLACAKSAECEKALHSFVEAALPQINKTRLDLLIRRTTTLEQRRGLFAVLLRFRRVIGLCASGFVDDATRRRRPQRSRRQMERRLITLVAAFAFGVRELRSPKELLE